MGGAAGRPGRADWHSCDRRAARRRVAPWTSLRDRRAPVRRPDDGAVSDAGGGDGARRSRGARRRLRPLRSVRGGGCGRRAVAAALDPRTG